MDKSAEQHKKQYEWLNPYKWKPGQSGNPAGKKPGKSLKTFVKEYLESLSDDDKVEFLKQIDAELAWKMAEGNPHQSNDMDHKGKVIIEIAKEIADKNEINSTPTDSSN